MANELMSELMCHLPNLQGTERVDTSLVHVFMPRVEVLWMPLNLL